MTRATPVSAATASVTSRSALLNVAGAFVLATIVKVLLHELAHALAGLAGRD